MAMKLTQGARRQARGELRRKAIDSARSALRDHRYPLPKLRTTAIQRTAPTVYFCTPDYDFPSGGVRVIYRHVDLLNQVGIPAFVLHRDPKFRCSWFDNTTRIAGSDRTRVGPQDVLVIGELAAPLFRERAAGTRFVVFNQNPHLTWQRVPRGMVQSYMASPDLAGVVVVSQHSLEMVRYLAPQANVLRVHNSIDPQLFHPADRRPARRIAYMPRRGRREAEHVLAMLSARGALEGWEVVALGGMTEREVADALRQTTVFVNFCYHEGFGLPAAEAMACGAYTVGFHGFAGREYFRREFSDPVESGDVLALGHAIERTIEREALEPGWCQVRGAAAARFIAREYSPGRESADVSAVYRGLLAGA
jgi:glycosyltransferase involved in cell wall biosynthesis